MTAFLRACAAASLLFATSSASASPSFPAVMDSELGLGCQPTCELCHVNGRGFATANTPLGRSMRKGGLKCCDDDGLVDVVRDFVASANDSDGDGVADMDELIARTDPNDSEAPLLCEVAQNYGGTRIFGTTCSASPAREEAAWGGMFALLSLIGLVYRRKKRET